MFPLWQFFRMGQGFLRFISKIVTTTMLGGWFLDYRLSPITWTKSALCDSRVINNPFSSRACILANNFNVKFNLEIFNNISLGAKGANLADQQ